jgi:hypothetical protein
MLFVMGCLAFFTVAFLIMLCVQAIRIEKNVLDTVERAEKSVAKLYETGGG